MWPVPVGSWWLCHESHWSFDFSLALPSPCPGVVVSMGPARTDLVLERLEDWVCPEPRGFLGFRMFSAETGKVPGKLGKSLGQVGYPIRGASSAWVAVSGGA